MSASREDNNNTIKTQDASASTHSGTDSALIMSTRKLQNTLQHRGSEILAQSFIFANAKDAALYPPATLLETDLFHSQENSDFHKSALGVKESSHKVEIVQFLEGGCDLVFSLPFSNSAELNNLPGSSNACYIITPEKKLYYADKARHLLKPINIPPKEFDAMLSVLLPDMNVKPEPGSFLCLVEKLSPDQLHHITQHSKHLHSMGFYKQSPKDAVVPQPLEAVWPLEAANSTAYQLLGAFNFPTCYAIRNSAHHYIGVLSMLLPGFRPNRDFALEKHHLEISSLKEMIKKRDDHDMRKLNEIFTTIKEILQLLQKRETAQKSGMLSSIWDRAVKTRHFYLGDESNAVHFKPELEKFIKLNAPSITFKKLETFRQLLIKRKMALEAAKTSYYAKQHEHDAELPLINRAIEQLNLILLDDIALFIKALHDIDKELRHSWVNLEAEKNNPTSKYANIQIADGLLAPLNVSLNDIMNYRIHIGQAIAQTSRYFLADPDGHAKNMSYDGLNVDGDLANYPLTYRFKNPGRKPGPNDFIFAVNDYINFPNLTVAKFRYWCTQTTILDTSADAALSQVSDVTKNYFTTKDNLNYSELEKSPVFNFQKYVQLIIFSLFNSRMLAACAKLHMPDNLPMLSSDGNPEAPLPLINTIGQRMDLQYKWVEGLTHRAQEAKVELALKLEPVKMILARHSDLALELVLDHFEQFIAFKRTELNGESLKLLEEAINPEVITKAFHLLKTEILSPDYVNTLPSTPSVPLRPH